MALLCLCLLPNWLRAATFLVTTNADSGTGSLRQAILDANAAAGANSIVFQITSGSPPYTITPATALPSLGNPTLIDGTTQAGFTGTPIIELNGTSAGGTTAGLQLLSSNNTVRGLVINRFGAQGIVLGGPSNVVQGSYIGTDVAGTNARANGSFGIWVKSAGNLIGGTNVGDGNVISGGNDTGIYVSGTSGNTIQGNLIGITATGTKALRNVNNGVVIDKGSGNTIGGMNAAARNVISGNGLSGVFLNASNATGNTILGNYIGLNSAGSGAVSNAADGITLYGAAGNVIGSAEVGGGNVISGNGFSGVAINIGTATNNLILGNYIGTDATGKSAVGNLNAGVVVSAAIGNQVGGINAGAGNVISGNKQDGIFLTDGAAGNLVQGNLIGLSAPGTNEVHNGFNGISLSGAVSNTIGGSLAGARNVISGNTSNGVGILQPGDRGNVVLGNYIGLDVTGSKAVGNTMAGVRVQGGSNVVGGIVPGSGNVISGNGQQGVWLVGTAGNVTGNLVLGNVIGLDATGASSLGNNADGVGITSAANNQVGGTSAGARNVIAANNGLGMFITGTGSTNNVVQGNYIGTDLTGTSGRGNAGSGITLQNTSSNRIGGSLSGAGNLISANNNRGLFLQNTKGNILHGNWIGTAVDGSAALGNLFHGIDLDTGATNNFIGGAASGEGNRLAFAQSVYCGVRVRNGSSNNVISGNAIFSNGALGIDLGNAGVNPIYDCQSGVPAGAANAGQNFPVLSNVYSGNGTRIRGTLDSGSGKTYVLQFFASPAGDASGYGEGQLFLGQTNLTLGAACSSNFTAYVSASVPANWVVTATATSPVNNTSEFSAWVPVVPVPSLQLAFGTDLGQIAVSWTNNSGVFSLQQTYSLSPPILWTTVNNSPVLINNNFVVSMPATNGSFFYRLSAP